MENQEINLEWTLTSEEKRDILSKINAIFYVGVQSPAVDQFIFKSSILSNSQQGIFTEWYLEMTSGKDFFTRINLCLANTNQFIDFCITYKLVFLTAIERASYKCQKIYKSETRQNSCPEKFLHSLYFKALLSNNYDIKFQCDMKIQPVRGTKNILHNVQDDYEKLLNDLKYSDFMLVTSTKTFNVHKNILAVRSEVFSAMFEHDMKEKKEGFVEIEEFSDEIVQELLRYIYCGKVANLDKLAKDLLLVI